MKLDNIDLNMAMELVDDLNNKIIDVQHLIDHQLDEGRYSKDDDRIVGGQMSSVRVGLRGALQTVMLVEQFLLKK